MRVIKIIENVFGWVLTIIFQIAASFLIIFLFSVIFAGLDTTSRLGWLGLLLGIWVGYVIGINLVGQLVLRWVLKGVRPLTIPRLVGTMIGGLIPLLILLPIGYSVPVGDSGSPFANLVTNNWQPILAQASLFVAIVGFYFPSLLPTRAPITQDQPKD